MNGAAFRFKWEVRDQAGGRPCYRTYFFHKPVKGEPDDTREYQAADGFQELDDSKKLIAAVADGLDASDAASNDMGALGLRREYLPLADFPELFLQFSKVPLTADGVLSFANKFGLLGLGDMAEPLSAWFEEIQLLHQLFELWVAYQKQDIDQMGQLTDLAIVSVDKISDTNEALKQVLESMDHAKLHRSIKYETSHLPAEETKSLNYVVLEYISTKTEARLSELVRPILLIDDKKNGLVLNLVPGSLLGAIWLQFASAVAGNKRYADCEVCGQPFEVKKRVKKTCSDRCRQALSRSKRDAKS